MTKEKLIEELARLQKDPRVREALKDGKGPENTDLAISRLAEIAAKFGYELREADILEAIQAMEAQVKAGTEAVAAQVERLTDDEVSAAAGGRKANCQDTYLDQENCWYTDGCDKNYVMYPDYQCHNNNAGAQCDEIYAVRCNEFFVECENKTISCLNEYYRPECGYTHASD